MAGKLFAASLWTLGLLFGMLAAIILLVGQRAGHISIGVVFAITALINILLWLLSPKITDWVQKIFYKATYFNQAQFSKAYPTYATFIAEKAAQNKTPFPKIGFINDNNPTAFSYGSGRWNSRLVFTKGVLTYLEEDEVKAVLAHELGHIVHRDFIVMSIANALIQFLYEVYYIFSRGSKGSNKGGGSLALIGWLAYIFYFIGVYIVLFLNRLREYYADEFSAQATDHPEDLENALVKIAYGIMAKEETSTSKRLLESTKTMGIMSLQSAKNAALVMKVTNMEPDKVARVMLFDIVSPWAKLAQLSATHPLTGRRLLRLERMASAKGLPERFNLEAARAAAGLNRLKLWRRFMLGSIVYFLPWILIIGYIAALFVLPSNYSGSESTVLVISFGIIALLMLVRLAYKYPSIAKAKTGTIYDLMTDLYASPLRGRAVQLKGSIIGRGVPGYVFGEDMMMQDDTGILYLDYSGRIPLISNLLFALKRLKALVGQNVVASGWFYRSNVQYLRLKRAEAGGQKIKSYPRLWSIVGIFIIASIGSLILAAVAGSNVNLSSKAHNLAISNVSFSNRCYSLVGPSGLSSDESNCNVVLKKPSAVQLLLHRDSLNYLNVRALPDSTSFEQTIATWSYNDPSVKIVSRTKTSVAGLPAWRFDTSLPGSSYKYVDYVVDSTSKITNSSSGFITDISSSYSNNNQYQQITNILNSLQIKTINLSAY